MSQILAKICFLSLHQNAGRVFYSQRKECAAPKRWSKYTTVDIPLVVKWSGRTFFSKPIKKPDILATILFICHPKTRHKKSGYKCFWYLNVRYPDLHYMTKTIEIVIIVESNKNQTTVGS